MLLLAIYRDSTTDRSRENDAYEPEDALYAPLIFPPISTIMHLLDESTTNQPIDTPKRTDGIRLQGTHLFYAPLVSAAIEKINSKKIDFSVADHNCGSVVNEIAYAFRGGKGPFEDIVSNHGIFTGFSQRLLTEQDWQELRDSFYNRRMTPEEYMGWVRDSLKEIRDQFGETNLKKYFNPDSSSLNSKPDYGVHAPKYLEAKGESPISQRAGYQALFATSTTNVNAHKGTVQNTDGTSGTQLRNREVPAPA